MNFTVYESITGQVLFCGDSAAPELLAKTGQTVWLDEKLLDGWVLSGAHTPLPPRPSQHHQFNYTTKQWEDPRTAATEWVQVRSKRDALLSETDWVVTKAVEIGSPVPANWKTYRQALRDVTKQADPFALVWPVQPTA